MPFVNLIKEERLAAATREKQIRIVVLACLAIGAVSFLGAGYFTYQAVQLKSKEAELKAALAKAKPYMEKVAANKAEIGKLEPRIQTLTSAQDSTMQWSRILEHLKMNMPQGVWLTAVQCQRQTPNQPVNVSIKGMSTSQEGVGYLILRTEQSKDIENPELVYTQERRTENGQALEFEIKGELAGSAPKKKQTKEVSGA